MPVRKYLVDLGLLLTAMTTITAQASCAARPAVPRPAGAIGPCAARSLQASAFWQGAGGTRVGSIVFQNHTQSSCFLAGYPGVTLMDASGTTLAVREVRVPFRSIRPVVLAPSKRAAASIQWANWCSNNTQFPVSIRVALPAHQGALPSQVQAVSGVPPCLAPANPSIIRVGPFRRQPSN